MSKRTAVWVTVSGKRRTKDKRHAGHRDVHVWFAPDVAAILDELQLRWGLLSVRDTLVQALMVARKEGK